MIRQPHLHLSLRHSHIATRLGTENLCVKMFKVGEPLHGGNPTLSAIDVGFQWYGKASQLENILGCKTNHVLKRCLKTSDVIWASKE